jgi:hypothetical protein
LVHFETFGDTWMFCSMTTVWMTCWKRNMKDFIKPYTFGHFQTLILIIGFELQFI